MANSPSDELDLGVTVRGFASGQKVFNRYSLVRILGRGGMGVVWLARDEELEREVALKFLPEMLLHDRSLLDSLKAETRRSLELTHRHIVRIYDFIQDAQSSCISMEYVDGDTLANVRVAKPNHVFETAELEPHVRDICEGLAYAHEKAQIVHRDLKPSNLMLNRRGEIKIADFGIARSLSESVSMITMQQHTSGTLPYMSPQQLEGERTSHLDDVYSLGAVLYELLTSKPPFFRGQIDHQIRTKAPDTLAERRAELGIKAGAVPGEWQETITACLAKKPTDRPQSAREIVDRLRPAAAPVVLSRAASDHAGNHESLVSPPQQRGATRKLRIYGGIAAALLLSSIVAYRFASDKAPAQASSPAKLETPAPQPETPAPGRVVVNTIPAGATVYLDGTDRGKSPIILQDVVPGAHHLSVEASDYEPNALIADVKAGGTVDFGTMQLRPKAATPSSASVASPPPVAQPSATVAASSAPARDLQTEIKNFVGEHLRKSVNANISGLINDYADRVDYYDNGVVDHSFLAKDRQTYAAAWPYLKLVPSGDVRLRETGITGQVAVSFNYSFEARNRKGVKSMGDTTNTWVLDTSDGGLKIVSEKQEVSNRRRTR